MENSGMFRRSVLMGDPTCFHIRGGANPHTRNRWGIRKKVNRDLALHQWHQLAKTLIKHDIDVYVVPPVPHSPGLVFPANAGFLTKLYSSIPMTEKSFYLSQTISSRRKEKDVYKRFLRKLGIRTREFPNQFEGEADFFPVGNKYIFTSGNIISSKKWVFQWGWPPYKITFGFRSNKNSMDNLIQIVAPSKILPLTLTRETHYHGDTCLCAFGKNREYLMAYLPALSLDSQHRLKELFKDNLLFLSEEDGELFSVNSFQIDSNPPLLLIPHTATEDLQKKIEERGVKTLKVDVSEFMTKGGGSIKCMIGDLGLLATQDDQITVATKNFREERNYKNIF